MQTTPALQFYTRNYCPEKATEGSSCYDLRADFAGQDITIYDSSNHVFQLAATANIRKNNPDKLFIYPGQRVLVPTGVTFAFSNRYSLRVYARSGHALKRGLSLANGVGIIDSDYNRECFVLLRNHSAVKVVIEQGERIAQCELQELLNYELESMDSPPELVESREGGFNSTGNQ